MSDINPDLVIDEATLNQRRDSIYALTKEEQHDYLWMRGWRQWRLQERGWYLPELHKMQNHTGHKLRDAIEIQLFQDLSKVKLHETSHHIKSSS